MEHYYSPEQSSKLVIYNIRAHLRGRVFEIKSASGIFSAKQIDHATNLLVNSAIIEDGWRILDLGCGCGIVGIVAASVCPTCEIVMSDVNKRALKIAKKNADDLNLKNVSVVESDVFANISGEFDTIIVNPPMVAGRDVCFKMISESKEHLKKGGLLQIVARHNKGGKMLKEKMEETFGNVKETAKRSGFRVYVSSKD